MKKQLISGFIFLAIALVVTFFPFTLDYVQTTYFNVSEFIKDYPEAYWPIDGLLWCVCIGCFIWAFLLYKRADTLIQISTTMGQGSGFLKAFFEHKGTSKNIVVIDDNLPADNPTENNVLAMVTLLRKETAEKIKERHINYLGIAYIPLIAKAGELVSNNGHKVTYWSFYRGKQKPKALPNHGKIQNSFSKTIEKQTESEDLLLVVESSYQMDLITPSDYFDKMDRICLKANTIGVDNVANEPTLTSMAQQVGQTINEAQGKYETIHLILCTNAPLSFAIGQQINSTNMPRVVVYQYVNQKDNNRPWGIQINKDEENSFVLTRKRRI